MKLKGLGDIIDFLDRDLHRQTTRNYRSRRNYRRDHHHRARTPRPRRLSRSPRCSDSDTAPAPTRWTPAARTRTPRRTPRICGSGAAPRRLTRSRLPSLPGTEKDQLDLELELETDLYYGPPF